MKRREEIEKLLVVVDMVNGFIKEGNMADPYINHITPRIVKLIEKVMEEDEGLVFVKDTHEKVQLNLKSFQYIV